MTANSDAEQLANFIAATGLSKSDYMSMTQRELAALNRALAKANKR